MAAVVRPIAAGALWSLIYGEAGLMIDEGQTAHGGCIPVSVSGGLLSKCIPSGDRRRRDLRDHVAPPRLGGDTSGRGDAKVGVTRVIGLGSACTINVLGV